MSSRMKTMSYTACTSSDGMMPDGNGIAALNEFRAAHRGRWFTTDLNYAAMHGQIRYVDISQLLFDASVPPVDPGRPLGYAEHVRMLPLDVASQAIPITNDVPSIPPGFVRMYRGEIIK